MTTEHDCEVMERLLEAARSGEVTSDHEWVALCRNLGATHAHLLAVTLMLGGRLPWQEARHE